MDQLSMLTNSHHLHEYTFEFGNASYETSLEERIQAARIQIQQDHEKRVLIINNNSKTSVQHRLIKAKEEIKAKSMLFYRNNEDLKPPLPFYSSNCIQRVSNLLVQNYNYKSTKVKSQRLNQNQKSSNEYKGQYNDNDSMEWENYFMPEDAVNEVNHFRESNLECEPMDWSPVTITMCDNINLCFVVDTNVYLTDLKSISMIINKMLPDYGYPTILLPWKVLQELDGLKRKENELGYQSRKATRWLLDMFSQKHPRLKGQIMVTKSTKNPDDEILECAINIKETANLVCLITDDKILTLKSGVHKIIAKDSVWLRNILVSQKN